MNKTRQILLGAGLVLITTSAHAAEISGNVTLASDYVYRGVSQTSEEPTIQGGFDVAADSGLYAGIWGANVAFDGSVEIDYYIGFGNDIYEGLSYDIGFLFYDYPNQDSVVQPTTPTLAEFTATLALFPGTLADFIADPSSDIRALYDAAYPVVSSPDSDFQEVYFNVTYQAFTVGVAFSSDFFGETGNATYVYGEYELSLPNDVSLVFHYGSQGIDKATGYDEYSISLSKEISDIDFSLSWHNTDVNKIDDFGSRIVFALSKSL